MKRNVLPVLALCMALLLLAGCAASSKGSANSSSSSYDMAAPAAEAPAEMMSMEESAAYDASSAALATGAAPASGQTGNAPADAGVRKIIYNANLDVTADAPADALQTILDKTASLGGYVASSYTTNDDDGAVRCIATLKVPSEKLDELVGTAKGTGKVTDYQLSSDDISLQYYDISARLSNAKAEEAQLVTILGQCKTIEDILAVRESLTAVRGDIESYQGQINLWDNLVGYATLYLTINRTPQPAVKGESELITIWKASDVWNRMSRGFVNSARFVVNAVGAIGIFLAVAIIPAAVLFVCIGLPILAARKRRRAKAAAAGEPLPPSMAAQRREKRHARRIKAIAPPEAEKPDEPGE